MHQSYVDRHVCFIYTYIYIYIYAYAPNFSFAFLVGVFFLHIFFLTFLWSNQFNYFQVLSLRFGVLFSIPFSYRICIISVYVDVLIKSLLVFGRLKLPGVWPRRLDFHPFITRGIYSNTADAFSSYRSEVLEVLLELWGVSLTDVTWQISQKLISNWCIFQNLGHTMSWF